MKKVIKGKLYDTETARRIDTVSGGAEFRTDFHYWEETLYCKKTGEYFLHCAGGEASQYAEKVGSLTGWGERIKPLSYDEAQQWAEKYLDGDQVIAEFGEPVEDVSKVQLHVNLRKGNVEKIKLRAQKMGVSVSELVDRMIKAME